MVSYIKEFVIQRFVISRLHSAVVNNNWKIQAFVSGAANWILFCNLSLFSIFLAFSFSNKYHFNAFKSNYLLSKNNLVLITH